jgi:DNA replication and repair protein RecF
MLLREDEPLTVPRRLSIERLQLVNFRNYETLAIATGPEPQVLVGANGSGKTNLIEAISLLVPGSGARSAHFRDIARANGDGSWTISTRAHSYFGPVDLGTRFVPPRTSDERAGRIVRIDGETKSGAGILAEYLDIVWLTPAMDGLFTGAASERRQFLDRLIASIDPGYRNIVNTFERAMTNRNRLLADGVSDNAQLEGFEISMAEAGIAISASRAATVRSLEGIIAARHARAPQSPFPWARLELEGVIDKSLLGHAAVDVEDEYRLMLRQMRERDRAAGRTLDGPHRSDLVVHHGPKEMPARLSSSGEQKLLLLGLVLAHAEMIREHKAGAAPILLLDEVTAHLDETRRAGLFDEIGKLGAQAWMTGTDRQAFEALSQGANFWVVDGDRLRPQ